MFFHYFADQKANLFETGMAILCASARLCTFVFTTQVTVIPPPTIGNSSKAPNPQTQTHLALLSSSRGYKQNAESTGFLQIHGKLFGFFSLSAFQ